jgi:hypothetical protein
MSATKNFKQFVLTAAILFAAANIMYAQSYQNSPGDSIISNANLDDVSVYTITQLHPGNDTIHFKYQKYSVTLPASWDALLCDNATCHPDLKDSSQMIAVPGDNGLMSLHLNPHWEAGTGIVRYLLYDVNTPAQIDTLTWIISAGAVAVTEQMDRQPFISLNRQTLTIKNADKRFKTLRILDIEGRIIYSSPVGISEQYTLPLFQTPFLVIHLSGNNFSWHQKIITH